MTPMPCCSAQRCKTCSSPDWKQCENTCKIFREALHPVQVLFISVYSSMVKLSSADSNAKPNLGGSSSLGFGNLQNVRIRQRLQQVRPGVDRAVPDHHHSSTCSTLFLKEKATPFNRSLSHHISRTTSHMISYDMPCIAIRIVLMSSMATPQKCENVWECLRSVPWLRAQSITLCELPKICSPCLTARQRPSVSRCLHVVTQILRGELHAACRSLKQLKQLKLKKSSGSTLWA